MSSSLTPPRFLPWIVWVVALILYIVAVMNRTSLSALGPAAQEHFHIGAATLSSFAVLQLIVYAAMQIPVGLMMDRFGVSRVMITGGLLMSGGQLGMALAEEVWVAVGARMLVGAGDAFIFTSAMRLLPDWFAPRMLPMLGQLTGMLGSLGQVVALFPLSLAVGVFGWAQGFIGVSVAGFLTVLIACVVLRDRPGSPTLFERLRKRRGHLSRRAELLLEDDSLGVGAMPSNTAMIQLPVQTGRGPIRRFFANWLVNLRIPGVRLAFWIHFSTPFSQHLMLLLWGTPLLVYGIGLAPHVASTVLVGMVLTGALFGLIFGRITARFVGQRVMFVIVTVASIGLVWLALLVWPGVPPLWLVLTVTTVTSAGGASSMVAFEVVRSHSPRRFIGLTTGTVNMGGFIAALTVTFLVGVVLDLQGAGSPETYSYDAFRWAFATQFLLWIPALVLLTVERRKTLAWVARDDLG